MGFSEAWVELIFTVFHVFPTSTSFLPPLANHNAHHRTTPHPVFECSIDVTWPVVQFQRPQNKNKSSNHEYCDFLFVMRKNAKIKNIFFLNTDRFNVELKFIVSTNLQHTCRVHETIFTFDFLQIFLFFFGVATHLLFETVEKKVVLWMNEGDNDIFRTSKVARRRSIRVPRSHQNLRVAVKELWKLRRHVD